MSKVMFFTSESVCAGHPDKIADGISDLLLDELLKQDLNSRTGIETVVGGNQIAIFGEIQSKAKIDVENLVRKHIKQLGYNNTDWGFSDQSNFYNYLHQQSSEISIGVDHEGAGDQGMMFGFACRETKDFMPLPISLAHSLTAKLDSIRLQGDLDWLRPDGKAQVTIRYVDGLPLFVEKIVMAVCHDRLVDLKQLRKDVIAKIIVPVLDEFKLKLPKSDNIIINGTGQWYIPGPESDAGLTGRKIVVDTYGGYARVGGGAFSGKDPSKVDRSGAYAARFIAKNIVAKGYADKCEVCLAYAIGQSQPLMQTIETFGTATVNDQIIDDYQRNLIDTSVSGIIKKLDLKRPFYSLTTNYSHFGKADLSYEKIIN